MNDTEREKLIQDLQFKIIASKNIKQTRKYIVEQRELISGRSPEQTANRDLQ